MDGQSCDVCDAVYNPYLGDRFWSGEWQVDGEVYRTLCDTHHRELVREN